MINDAQVFLAGYVTAQPSFSFTKNGVPRAKLRVAYTERRLNRETGEWSDGHTTFVDVVCWRGLANNVAMSVRKGEPVLVRGRLQVRSFKDPAGASRYTVEVDASSVGHDLARGAAAFSRTHRAAGQTAAQLAAVTARPAEAEVPPGGAGPVTADVILADVAGDDVVDEQAVAEFARELDESLGESASEPPGDEDGGVSVPA